MEERRLEGSRYASRITSVVAIRREIACPSRDTQHYSSNGGSMPFPVTSTGYRVGQPPANASQKLPSEMLSRQGART